MAKGPRIIFVLAHKKVGEKYAPDIFLPIGASGCYFAPDTGSKRHSLGGDQDGERRRLGNSFEAAKG